MISGSSLNLKPYETPYLETSKEAGMTKTSTHTPRSRIDIKTLRVNAIEARSAAAAALAAAERAEDEVEPRPPNSLSDTHAVEQSQRQTKRETLRRRLWTAVYRTVVVILLLTALAATASGVKAVWDHRAIERRDSADRAVMQFAEDAVVQLISTNEDDPDIYVQRVLDNAAGQWHDDFDARKQSVLDTMRAAGNVTIGRAVKSGIDRRNTDGSTTVLVAASADGKVSLAGLAPAASTAGADNDGTQSSDANPDMTVTIEPQEYQLRVDVVDVDGQLKLSKVGFVQ